MSTPTPDKVWKKIKDAVHDRGMTLTELAAHNGLHPSTLRKVKGLTHYEGQAVLAAFIGTTPEKLWPDRYPRKTSVIYNSNKYGPPKSRKSISDQEAA
ncbi:helix-turn-helix domain-containing protein [Martelella mediterranea]|uniref:Ner family transcriptional regulator n=1 Tax=Martelella mediterranea TaxID=293089 RepID=A0A4R3NMC5_9HYPH|nr:helix-turn-helix domain-containing protein [Martelella mediterranea]TCT35411.1 Ner family transcriptional regulator [Martelella mediterranea]